MGVAAPRAKRMKNFMLHIHATQEAFSWHIGYSIHYVMLGLHTYFTERTKPGSLSLRSFIYSIGKPFFHTQLEAWGRVYIICERLLGHKQKLLGHKQKLLGHVPHVVCPSLATPLLPRFHPLKLSKLLVFFSLTLYRMGTLHWIWRKRKDTQRCARSCLLTDTECRILVDTYTYFLEDTECTLL